MSEEEFCLSSGLALVNTILDIQLISDEPQADKSVFWNGSVRPPFFARVFKMKSTINPDPDYAIFEMQIINSGSFLAIITTDINPRVNGRISQDAILLP